MKLSFGANKTLLGNMASLSILNALNMALPLVSIPYLIATIGSANYGAYSITYTILQYVLLIGAYGFNCTTTKQIAQNRENLNYISSLFSCTIAARLFLTTLSAFIFFVVVLLLFPGYKLMYLLGLGIVYGDILNPVWLFQGMENMKYMTIVNAISKILFTLLIFIFIKDSNDFVYVTLLNSAGFIVAGFVSLILAIKIFHVRFTKITFADIKTQLIDSGIVFFSSAFVSLYNNSFVFIMGMLISESSVGIYATVEKIIKAAKSIIEPISVALFPHVAQSFVGRSHSENIYILFNYTKKLLILLISVTLGLLIFAPLASNLFLSSIADRSTVLIRLMSPLVIIGGLNYMFGVVGLINLNMQKEWLRILIISSIISLVVLVLSTRYMDYYAAILSSFTAEFLIFVQSFFLLYKLRK